MDYLGKFKLINITVILIFFIGCDKEKSDFIKILEVSPSPEVQLIKGSTVSFEFKIKYRLKSTNKAVISIVTQDQYGKRIGEITPSKMVEKGEGEIIIQHTIFIPQHVNLIEFFTPLWLEGKTITGTVDKISYSVISISNQSQNTNILDKENPLTMTLPVLDLKEFLRYTKQDGNAAKFYIEALNIFTQDNEAKGLFNNLKLLITRPLILKAMAKIFDGTNYKNCDFTEYYPPFGNLLKGNLPNFKNFEILANAMSYSAIDYAQKNNFKTAKDIGLAIISLGTHLRESAFTSTQYYWGIKIQKVGFESLAKIVTDLDLQKKIDINLSLLNETENIFRKKQINLRRDAPYWQITPSLPENIIEFLHFLDDAEPIFRIEALQIISTWCDSNNYAQLQLEKDKNFWKFQNSLRDSLPKVKEKIEKISMNDHDSRVKLISLIVLKELKI